jgi:uncharacterized protein (TIGR03083 family)
METSRLLDCLADDYARLHDVAAGDVTAVVPSCPGWTVTDLVRHVATVYQHKTEAMRQQRFPEPWPPDFSGAEPVALLERSYAALAAEFAARQPEDPAFTWHAPDQTVRFWIRRMAQETVIHRVDAELALGEKLAPIPDDLAVDGVDEVLRLFLDYGSHAWHGEFVDALGEWGERTLLVAAQGVDGADWRVAVHSNGAEVRSGLTGTEPEATIRGEPVPLLLSLWNRGGSDGVTTAGDLSMIEEVRRLLTIATQ